MGTHESAGRKQRDRVLHAARRGLHVVWIQRDPLKPVPPSRHPFQVWIVAAAAVSGWSTVTNGVAPGSMQERLPEVSVFAWAGLLLVGGALALIAAYWRDQITALLLERIGLFAIAGAEAVYAFVLWKTFHGTQGMQGPALNGALVICSLWRIRQVNRELRRMSRMISSWSN